MRVWRAANRVWLLLLSLMRLAGSTLWAAQLLRGLAGQLLIDAPLVEADDPAAADLYHGHTRLPRLAHDVAGCLLITFDIDLLERNSLFFEVTLCPTTPRARGCAEQHHPGQPTTSFAIRSTTSTRYNLLTGPRHANAQRPCIRIRQVANILARSGEIDLPDPPYAVPGVEDAALSPRTPGVRVGELVREQRTFGAYARQGDIEFLARLRRQNAGLSFWVEHHQYVLANPGFWHPSRAFFEPE